MLNASIEPLPVQVIANYGENKGTALLTVDQRRWCDLKKVGLELGDFLSKNFH